jgi:hypothetical protein
LGARLLTHSRDAANIGFLVRAGNDFPDDIANELKEWQTRLEIRTEESTPSTRGLLIYEDTKCSSIRGPMYTMSLSLTCRYLANQVTARFDAIA